MTIINNIASQDEGLDELSFGQRIAYIIESRGLSKAWIAEKLGISKQALNYLLKHSTTSKFVDELADLLELNPEWLEKGTGQPVIKNRNTEKINAIPICSKKMLLYPENNSHDFNGSIDFATNNINHIIAYKLDDNSNFPPFIQGSILIFNTKKQVTNEDYVLVIIENDVFVRQYLVDGNNICYKASNHEHKTFINSKAKLLGVLLEARYQIN